MPRLFCGPPRRCSARGTTTRTFASCLRTAYRMSPPASPRSWFVTDECRAGVKCRKSYQFLGEKEFPSRKYQFQQAIRGWHFECGTWPLEAATGRIVKKADTPRVTEGGPPNAPVNRPQHSS